MSSPSDSHPYGSHPGSGSIDSGPPTLGAHATTVATKFLDHNEVLRRSIERPMSFVGDDEDTSPHSDWHDGWPLPPRY